jgi:hypothetical protein
MNNDYVATINWQLTSSGNSRDIRNAKLSLDSWQLPVGSAFGGMLISPPMD